MLTFLPGELSTIAGPLADCNIDYCSFSTRAYNFRDLPCPPQSVMVSTKKSLTSLHREYVAEMNVQEENWYKPQPGEPYRPLIAMPEQIRKIRPYYSRCTDNFFTGFDPPRTLAPAAALAPTITTRDPETFATVPKPSHTPDAGAIKTAHSQPPMITPAGSPVVLEPQKPSVQASDANHELSDPPNKVDGSKPPKVHPAQPRPNRVEISSSHHYGNNANAVPGEGKEPTSTLIPVPTIAAGLKDGGSSKNTDPIVHDIPSPGDNADPAVGEPAESHYQDKPDAPQQIHNADGTVSDPGAKHPSGVVPSIGTKENPENYSPSKPSQSTDTGENPAKDDSNNRYQPANVVVDNGEKKPSNPNQSMGDPGNDSVSELDHSADIITDLEKVKEYTSELIHLTETTGDLGKETSSKLDSLLETISETIKGLEYENPSLSNLSDEISVEPETSDIATPDNEPGKPHGSPQAKSGTPTTHATFPSIPLKTNANGTLGRPNASANATETGAASNHNGKYIAPGSGNGSTQPYPSSVNRYSTSMGSRVRVLRGKAWVVLAIVTVLLWIG